MLEGRSEVILVGEYAGNGRSGSSAGWARHRSVGLGLFRKNWGGGCVLRLLCVGMTQGCAEVLGRRNESGRVRRVRVACASERELMVRVKEKKREKKVGRG